MKKYKINLALEYEMEAKDKDDVYAKLEQELAVSNTTGNNEFWDNLEVKEIQG